MSQYLNSPFVDSCGSLAIGVLLGSVAAFLVRRNIASLVERRMDIRREREIVKVLEGDGVVRSVHDVKSTMLGGDYVRFKAEILFNGEQVAKRYLHSLPPAILKREMEMLKECSSEKEMRQWIVRHGSGIIGMLGSEVDRIEWEIKKAVPEVKHCDLEIL